MCGQVKLLLDLHVTRTITTRKPISDRVLCLVMFSRHSTEGHMMMMATKNCSAKPSRTPLEIMTLTLSAKLLRERGDEL